MAEYRGRSNVNSVKRSKAMARPKEQQAGWINVREKKKKDKGNHRKVGENEKRNL